MCLLLVLTYAACTDGKREGKQRVLRELPPELVRHLESSDDSALTRYGREVGINVLMDASKVLNGRISTLYREGKGLEAVPLEERCKRIARVLAAEYHYALYLDRLLYFDRLSPDVRRSVLELESDYYSFRDEIHRSAPEKIERFLQFLDLFERCGDRLFVASCEYDLSYAYGDVGDTLRRIEYLRTACRDFSGCGLHEMTCPVLFELGEYCETIGALDSMIACFEKAGRIAHRSRLPWEAAQVSSLYATYYARRGRLALAYDLLSDAVEICRLYRGEYWELEYIVEMMSYQADIGCWEIVDRLLERARVLQKMCEGGRVDYIGLYALQIDRLEARLLLARGEIERAGSIFRRTGRAIDELNMPYTREPENAKLYLHWSRGLLENGRAREAVEIVREGYRYAEAADAPEYTARLALLEAGAASELGDAAGCELALRKFEGAAGEDETVMRRERIERDALLGASALRGGDRAGALRALEDGLIRLERYAADMDASVQSYLWIGECDGLRYLMHDISSHDPAAGYGTELYWRHFYRLLGSRARWGGDADFAGAGEAAGRSSPPAPRASGSITDTLRARGEALRTRLGALEAVHCVYLVRDDAIWRWTASAAGVRRDILDEPAHAMRERALQAWKMMSGENQAAVPEETLRAALRALAHVLLPPEIRDVPSAPSAGPFLVTTDGFLGLVPFEALDAGEGSEYVPLLMRRDVAYLRYADATAGTPRALPGVILADVEPSKRLLRRYPFQPELEEAVAEGEAAAALFPDARFLTGNSASKANLTSTWENVSFVYIAAHVLRDPQVPYLMLIPLASPGESAGPDAAYLDVTDIRAADLSNCRVVILSGCSSGTPYLESRIAGPSLGDAFLDSGAGAVVHTFWDIGDVEARKLMTSFMQTWSGPHGSDIRTLCDVRRAAYLSSKKEAGKPFGWASYAIEIGRL